MEVFLQYLERPDIAAAPTEEYLRTLLKRYPWFTTARLMLSRISGKVDPALSLYLATRPAPGCCSVRPGHRVFRPLSGHRAPLPMLWVRMWMKVRLRSRDPWLWRTPPV